jgi:serine/threonine protein kinase
MTGLTLPNGWKVVGPVGKAINATGGHFSSNYEVEHEDGRRAFLKAIDYSEALQSRDPARRLQELTTAFNFERDLVRNCADKRLSRVITALDDGHVDVPGPFPYPQVGYLIFELADGDIRKFREVSGTIDVAWALRTLHHVAVGLRQLHVNEIAHQDLKPSNVMTFGADLSKIGDLGRASVRSGGSPYDDFFCAGDIGYAPPEAFYGLTLPDWDSRRRATDLYHLGSLLLFQFTGVNATGALFSELDDAYLPAQWGGKFDDVVIQLRAANDRVAEAFPDLQDSELRASAQARFRELCEPDPRHRGHPKHRIKHDNPYSLERYVSYFNAMAARAERRLVKITVP